jgi:hypothetical protein
LGSLGEGRAAALPTPPLRSPKPPGTAGPQSAPLSNTERPAARRAGVHPNARGSPPNGPLPAPLFPPPPQKSLTRLPRGLAVMSQRQIWASSLPLSRWPATRRVAVWRVAARCWGVAADCGGVGLQIVAAWGCGGVRRPTCPTTPTNQPQKTPQTLLTPVEGAPRQAVPLQNPPQSTPNNPRPSSPLWKGLHARPYPSVRWPMSRRSGLHTPSAGGLEGWRAQSNTHTWGGGGTAFGGWGGGVAGRTALCRVC